MSGSPFHLILDLGDLPAFQNPAFRKLCDQLLVTRLLIAAHRYGAARISIVGSPTVVSEARERLLRDPRLRDLPIEWGTITQDDLPVVRGHADVAIGKVAWERLAAAAQPVYLPGLPDWRKFPDAEQPAPLWSDNEDEPGLWAIHIRSEDDLRAAKQEVFRNITKSTSGPVSRYLNSRLSIPLSKLLVETPLTPNQMTIINTVIGISSALCLATGDLRFVALGGLLFQLSSALDRNDGELARAKFMESERGAWIDTVGDNLTYIAFVFCLVFGYHRYAVEHDLAWARLVVPLGVLLIASTVGLIGWMLWYVRKQRLGGTVTAISRQFESSIDQKRVSPLYRALARLRVLGERDQFSLAVMFLCVMPLITGNDAWYHALFFGTLGAIALMNVYFLTSVRRLRRQQRESSA